MSDERQVIAAHEAGHAVAAHLLGRDMQFVSMETAWGFPASLDRMPMARLGERPPEMWHVLSDDVLIWLAGPLCADASSVTFPDRGEPAGDRGDYDSAEQAVRAITSSEEEYRYLANALRLRARGVVKHPHFRALHEHLTEALLRDGHLDRGEIRCELQRAHLHYTTTEMEAHNGPQDRS